MSRVLVFSAGTHPEPAHLAAGIARQHDSVTFYTSAMWPVDHPVIRLGRSRLLPQRVRSELLRRELPGDLTVRTASTRMSPAEAMTQVGMRVMPRAAGDLVRARTVLFRRAAGRITRVSADVEVVVAQYTSALDAFRYAGTARKVLLYPIAHHRWMRDYMGAQAVLDEEWAPFLQGHDISGRFERELDEEIELADRIVVPSTFALETFLSQGVPASKLTTLGLGTDLGGSPPALETPDRFTVLFAGQVNQRKGIGYLLKAFEKAAIPDAKLLIIGSAGEAIRAKITAEYPSVNFLPPMPRWELKQHMRGVSVLVMPSLAEGYGLVALEAMSVGTPAIVTPHTFGADVITHGVDGWITPSAEWEGLAGLLESISESRQELSRISEAAAATAWKHSWFVYGERGAAIVQEECSRA